MMDPHLGNFVVFFSFYSLFSLLIISLLRVNINVNGWMGGYIDGSILACMAGQL